MGLVGHARTTLNSLLPMLHAKTDRTLLESVQARKQTFEAAKDAEADISRDTDLIHPQAIASTISEHGRMMRSSASIRAKSLSGHLITCA